MLALLLTIGGVQAAEPGAAAESGGAVEKSADVVTELDVEAPIEVLLPLITDLPSLPQLWGPDCVGSFTAGSPASGLGAKANLRYDFAAMHRRLDLTVTRADAGPPAVVDYDHAGNRGFITRWVLTPTAAGTHLKVTTALNAPPWPFKAYFFNAIHKEWSSCQAGMVGALGARAQQAAASSGAHSGASDEVAPSAP
jgi:hypothetical protein